MDNLENIPDQEVFGNIIYLIVELILLENKSKNLNNDLHKNSLFDCMMKSKNSRYFKEYLIHLLNQGQQDQTEHTMQLIKLVFINQLEEFFYSNDLKIILDV